MSGPRASMIFGQSALGHRQPRPVPIERPMNRAALLPSLAGALAALAACSATPAVHHSADSRQAESSQWKGWLSWRGPDHNGTSPETGLVDSVTVDGENHLWSYPIAGRGTPVVANGRVFGLGYEGSGPELEEVLFCLDEETGERIWEHRESDFLTDVIYSRYAIGSPTVDPATGNVFALTGAGLVNAFTRDGELLWQVSMAEELGRLSFPNGRTGAPLIQDDLVIVHFIFAGWGPTMGPARDRFFAFDKHTGQVAWSSTPGGPPKDSSFAFPVVEERDGRTLLYAGLGGGHVACVDARTGEAVWRFPLAIGGVNGSALLYGDRLIAIHGKENVDTSTIGRMVCLRLGVEPNADGVLEGAEVWRNDLVAFTSSPVLVGNRVYQTVLTGELACVDADTGEVLWHEKLAPDQLHASPLAADGKLYVPMTNGSFHILRPSDEGVEVLDTEQLAGSCLGAPAVSGGRIYVHTTEQLYCFGEPKGGAPSWPVASSADAEPGEPVALQVFPADVTVRAGHEVGFSARRIDANGRIVDRLDPGQPEWTLPAFVAAGKPGVGVAKGTFEGLTGTARVRVVPALPFREDFESFEFTEGGDSPFAYPPGYWLGGRMKWMVRELEGEKVVARRMDNPLFQRTMSLFGHPEDANYTVQVDLRTDGNRRSMSSAGVVNQRYQIVLKGNYQELEVSSNMERLKVSVPYRWKAGEWYTMKTRVDVADDGSGVVRAKVWPRVEEEPEAWTIEVPDPHAHTHGAAGVYGFTPQSRFSVYLDNLSVTPNE